MLKQALGTAVAAVFATAIAGAQVPAQEQQEPRDYQAGQQMVTVEGCLQADRVAVADDDKTFLLVNAEVQPRAEEVAEARPGEPAPQPGVGRPDAQPETPVGTTGVAETATKFKVTGLEDERLEQYAGQRVRIEGHIARAEAPHAEPLGPDRPDTERPIPDPAIPDPDPAAPATPDAPESPVTGTAGHDHDRAAAGEMKELRAVSIQPVAGTCPESPADQ